jgi:predicted dehydrogenase
MIKVGVIGFGYWGPNIVRTFLSLPGSTVVSVCDFDANRLTAARERYPSVRLTQDPSDIISDPSVDLVAVVTPVFSHHELALRALQNGKHVLVEKPFTASSSQAEELIEMAEKNGLRIAVDHTFLFHSAVRAIKELIAGDRLGQIYYYDSTRINLGLFQQDVNVVWDLAPHDFSIMDYILNERPESVAAHGMGHLNGGQQDVAYVTAFFPGNLIAHFNFNWLSPVKVRRTLIGGEKQMCLWDDMVGDEKIKLYDKGVSVTTKEGYYRLLVEYRKGDIHSPFLEHAEPLHEEAKYLVDAISTGKPIINDGQAGLRVVRLLEACDESIRNGGKIVTL